MVVNSVTKMPNIVYSVDERVEMVKQYEQGMSYRRIVDNFAKAHPSRPVPAVGTVRTTIQKFRKTGNLDPREEKRSYPSRQLSAEVKFNICLKAEEAPDKPASKIAEELQVSKASVQRILTSAKLRSRKQNKHEESSLSGDEKTETTFSDNMMNRLKINESCLRRVCFSNETTILFVSQSNKQKIRLCSWRIQHRYIIRPETEYQKLHVWIGAVDNKPIGPFFLEGVLTGEKYLKMLREEILPAIRAMDGDGPVFWYQRDGAPPYWTTDVFTYLNQEFSTRWIGRGCRIQCRRSTALDMTVLDHALLGRLKNLLYSGEKIEDLSALRNKVSEIIGSMDPQAVCSTIRAYYERGLRRE